ncbi:hypothetical protein [uncultured Aliiroseovarius sp.]|nr:hypothetical protein [uncultured Aliiroseovarius sp.]
MTQKHQKTTLERRSLLRFLSFVPLCLMIGRAQGAQVTARGGWVLRADDI